jgi:hypothetical protein
MRDANCVLRVPCCVSGLQLRPAGVLYVVARRLRATFGCPAPCFGMEYAHYIRLIAVGQGGDRVARLGTKRLNRRIASKQRSSLPRRLILLRHAYGKYLW